MDAVRLILLFAVGVIVTPLAAPAQTPGLLPRSTRRLSLTEVFPPFSRSSGRKIALPYAWLSSQTLIALKNTATSGQLIEINVRTGQQRRLAEGVSLPSLEGIHSSPDGQKYCYKRGATSPKASGFVFNCHLLKSLPTEPTLPCLPIIDISWSRDNLLNFSHWERLWVVRAGSKTGTMLSSCAIYEVPVDKPTQDELQPRFDLFDDEASFHASVTSHPTWSKDGKRLAFVRNGDIWLAQRTTELVLP